MIYVLLYIFWVTSGMGAAAYAAFSDKQLPNSVFHPYSTLKRGFDDRVFTMFAMSFFSLFIGPFMWIYLISKHHKLLKELLKNKNIEVNKDAELAEKLVDKVLDLRENSAG